MPSNIQIATLMIRINKQLCLAKYMYIQKVPICILHILIHHAEQECAIQNLCDL